MFQRNIAAQLVRRMGFSPALLVIGPRQCGKTTLCKLIGEERGMEYISCDNIATLASVQYDPVGFLREQKKPLIVDEAQRVPELFLPIKVDIDDNRFPGRYLLTGSANPLLVPKLGDGLTGRMGVCNLWPLSQGELIGVQETFIEKLFSDEKFESSYTSLSQRDLIQKLQLGGFPVLQSLPSMVERRQWCNDYLFNALQKDINDLSKIEHFSQMPSLLYGLASRTGSPLNMNSLTALMRTSEATIRRYIELLKSLFLLYSLPAWGRTIDKKLAKASKVYFSDTAFFLHVLDFDEERLQKIPNVLGQVLENFIVMELVKQSTWSLQQVKLYHYRTHDQKEVDIVLEAPSGKIVGIEIKLADVVRKEDLKGLLSLKESAGNDFCRGIVLYTGDKVLPFGPDCFAIPMTALYTQTT